ncbi:MAG: hypothetical protein KKC79_17960, partial [Gammaproteobacteria bacterium]|nr:hypothetical protein [Gammaproteobacteria bacterium]
VVRVGALITFFLCTPARDASSNGPNAVASPSLPRRTAQAFQQNANGETTPKHAVVGRYASRATSNIFML